MDYPPVSLESVKSFQTIHNVADQIKLQIWKTEDQTLAYHKKKKKPKCPLKSNLK